MPPQVATLVCIIGIAGLFVLDRDRRARTSMALWIPVIWLWIVGSREVSIWLASFGIGGATTGDTYLEGSPVDRVVYLGLLLVGIVVLATRGHKVARLLQNNLPIVLFFCYCALSVLWSDHADIAFKRWIKSLGDLVMVLIVLTETDRLAAIKRFLLRASFLLMPLSILFIKYYPSLGKGFKHYGLAIYVGVTTTKNILGVICLLFGLASLWCLIAAYRDRAAKHRSRHLIVHSTVLAMVFWLFSMAHSMTGLACFVLAGGLMIAVSVRAVAQRPILVHLLVAAVVAISFAALFLGVGAGSLQAMGKDVTLTGRTEIWRLVLGMTGNPLIGTGFESFWLPGWRLEKIWSVYWWHPNEAHNGYIEVFLNLGWIGVSLLAVLLVTGYRNVLAALREDPNLGRLRLSYFVVAVVYNFTEAGFRMLDPIWIMFLMVIIAVPNRARASKASIPLTAKYADELPAPELDADRLPAFPTAHIGSL